MRVHLSNLGLPMLAKDLREMAQRSRTYTVRVVFALVIFSMSGVLFLPIYRTTRNAPAGLLGHGAELLYVSYVIEWFGMCLFVPAVVSGALAAEKERNTLQLLFLTRLGPWTILLEKLLSRFVPVATFLLVSLPLLFIASVLGGVTRSDVEFAALGLAVTAFQVGCISLFCSAYCATSASAFLMSYLLMLFVFLFPPLTYFVVVFVDPSLVPSILGSAWHFWLNSTQGMTPWIYMPGAAFRPYHTSKWPLLVISGIGLFFLLLARLAIVRRSAPQPTYRVRRFFQWLDRGFGWVNDRLARGIVFGGSRHDLPGDKPVAWRESRRGNLGRVNYLVRILFVLEFPILFPTVLYVLTTRDVTFSGLSAPGLLLWTIALLVVFVRSAGLIAAEKARQTLDVLLATPLPLSALVGQKMRGLWRVLAVVSVPIVVQAMFIGYFQTSASGWRNSYYSRQGFDPSQSAELHVIVVGLNLVILLGLAAQLAFLFGLTAKTQGRAVTGVLGLFVAWSFIPVVVRMFGDTGGWTLYLSPISGLLMNEYPEVGRTWWLHGGTEEGRWGFYLLVHFGIYATIVATLAWINQLLARRVLLRPSRALSPQILNAP
jgi:ABC-type transport system involved in multi-copper enzyme maturation permease subunit